MQTPVKLTSAANAKVLDKADTAIPNYFFLTKQEREFLSLTKYRNYHRHQSKWLGDINGGFQLSIILDVALPNPQKLLVVAIAQEFVLIALLLLGNDSRSEYPLCSKWEFVAAKILPLV